MEELDAVMKNTHGRKYTRFQASLNSGYVDDISGMSGGPILGFSEKLGGYFIVAIQSTWLPKEKICFGCPLPILASIFENIIDSEQGAV